MIQKDIKNLDDLADYIFKIANDVNIPLKKITLVRK